MRTSNTIDIALASRDPEAMRHALASLPDEALHPAAPQLARLAADFEAREQVDDALLCRDLVIRAWPDRASPRLERARLYMRVGRMEDALADCDAAVARDPKLRGVAGVRAQAHDALGHADAAIAAYREAIAEAGNDAASMQARVDALEAQVRTQAALARLLGDGTPPGDPAGPSAANRSPATDPAAESTSIRFDPALLVDPAMDSKVEAFRRDGLVQHLRRYSAHQHVRNALEHIQDTGWQEFWARALPALGGRRVAMHGSGLGLLALHALALGAQRVTCIEASAQSARITAGIAHKHHLVAWHALHGEAIRQWDEAAQSASFEAFTTRFDILVDDEHSQHPADCDAFVFTAFDHTLLGTGIVPAVRAFLAACDPAATALLMPARATVHAMAVEWRDPDTATDLSSLRPLRWSAYPQPFDLPASCWRPLTAPTQVATIDFAAFSPADERIVLDVTSDGIADAIVFWYELQLGDVVVSTAPQSIQDTVPAGQAASHASTNTLRPAMQYIDPVACRAGGQLPLCLRLRDTRLSLLSEPPPTQLRGDSLPGWHMPMLADTVRDTAYRQAITRALHAHPAARVLNPGTGCGTLALALHRLGATDVTTSGHVPVLARAGGQLIAANVQSGTGTIRHVARDLRSISVPDDMPARADMMVFDQFDCSLIGEGILHYLAHARTHLLEPDARIVPACAVLRAQLIEHRIDRVYGIDATLLNPFLHSPGFINVDASRIPWTPLGEAFDVFRFDFATATPDPQRVRIETPMHARGVAGAVLFWFDLELDADTRLSNAPDAEPASHWHQGLQFLPEMTIEPGLSLPLIAEHDGSALKFSWDSEAIDRSRLVPMPRFDPRTAMAAADLEQRTRELLQHCAQAPDEHARVAEIAMRIAVDPGAHRVDPVIAQRFLSLLMGR